MLTARPQVIRVGSQTSRPLTLNTRSPQAGVISPQLYSLYTHDCVAKSNSNTTVNDEKAYLEEVANLSLWCQDNSLMLNVSKTKQLIVDFRRTQQQSEDLHTTGD